VGKRGARIARIAAAVLITALAALFILNLSLGDKTIDRRVETLYAVADPQFQRTMGALLGPALVPGNHAVALVNGDEIFPAMLKAIREAQRTIDFETYIYWSGATGKAFADALSERARAGVRVSVLLDWIGSGKLDERLLEAMRSSGVEVQRYNRPRWYNLGRLNTAPIASFSSSTAASASRAVWVSPTHGLETRRIPSTGATRTSRSRGRSWHRCRRRFSTTGWK